MLGAVARGHFVRQRVVDVPQFRVSASDTLKAAEHQTLEFGVPGFEPFDKVLPPRDHLTSLGGFRSLHSLEAFDMAP